MSQKVHFCCYLRYLSVRELPANHIKPKSTPKGLRRSQDAQRSPRASQREAKGPQRHLKGAKGSSRNPKGSRRRSKLTSKEIRAPQRCQGKSRRTRSIFQTPDQPPQRTLCYKAVTKSDARILRTFFSNKVKFKFHILIESIIMDQCCLYPIHAEGKPVVYTALCRGRTTDWLPVWTRTLLYSETF